MSERGQRKEMVGTVIRSKMAKTVIVEARHRVSHPKYKKVILRKSKFYAHDEKGTVKLGDVVRLRETRPISKLKRWTVVEVIRTGKYVEPVVLEGVTT